MATVQLFVLFAEVVHEDFLMCSCVFIFVCDVQLSSVFSMVTCVRFVCRLRCTHLGVNFSSQDKFIKYCSSYGEKSVQFLLKHNQH